MTMTTAGDSRGRGRGGCGPTISTTPPGIMCFTCQGPHYQCDCPIEQKKKQSNQSEDLHIIHATTSHLKVKHQATIVESTCMIKVIPLSILIDPSATNGFISFSSL